MHRPPSSERFFSRGIGPSTICYPKRGVCTQHGGNNVLSGGAGSRIVARRHCGQAGRTLLCSLWLSLPPSVSPTLSSCPPGRPVPPATIPVELQMPADAEWYLWPPNASARGVMAATQMGPGACGWASDRWADSEPGWARARYGQVCPGRAGTARLYHDIQVFPLPVLSLAVRTEPDHKHSN